MRDKDLCNCDQALALAREVLRLRRVLRDVAYRSAGAAVREDAPMTSESRLGEVHQTVVLALAAEYAVEELAEEKAA